MGAEIWRGATPLDIRILVPFKLGFAIDLGELLGASVSGATGNEQRAEILQRLLHRNPFTASWRGPSSLNEDRFTRGHYRARAHSKRPAFFLSSAFQADRDLTDRSRRIRRRLNLSEPKIRFSVQDFGVGLAEFRATYKASPSLRSPVEYSSLVNDLCDVAIKWINEVVPSLDSFLETVMREAGYLVIQTQAIQLFEGDEVNDEDDVYRAYWAHALTVLTSEEPAVVTQAWMDSLRNTGRFPATGHPIDAIIAIRAAAHVSLPTRRLDYELFVGWGCSFGVIVRNQDEADLDDAVPTEIVLHLAQSFNATLYDLNRQVLQASAILLSGAVRDARLDLGRLTRLIEQFSERFDLMISLLAEERFCLSPVEQKVWDATFSQWATDRLISDLRTSLDQLASLARREQTARDDRRARRIAAAVTIITVTSAAALLYEMIPNLLEIRDPSRMVLAAQSIVLLIFVALGWLLVREMKQRRPRPRSANRPVWDRP